MYFTGMSWASAMRSPFTGLCSLAPCAASTIVALTA